MVENNIPGHDHTSQNTASEQQGQRRGKHCISDMRSAWLSSESHNPSLIPQHWVRFRLPNQPKIL